ncbi:MAG: hypothetical protein C4347_02145 [Patescibacteria group bacterium]
MKERKIFEVIKVISEILKIFNPFKDTIFTVVDIRLPKRKGKMKVYLSVFPEKNEEKLLNHFNRIGKEIKNEFKEKIYLRHLPSKIVFLPSKEFKEAQRVYELIDKIKKDVIK